jgi:predicted DNA-binding transcriptional regulator YafY
MLKGVDGLTGRLFKVVDLLQSQGRLTTEALALQLGVSERTVRRDITRLQTLEVSVEVIPGRGGGISLMPGSLLPALRFTDDEALALGFGLLLARRSANVALEKATRSASKRLSNVLSERLRHRLEALATVLAEPPIELPEGEAVPSSLILDLAEAIKTSRQVELSYRSRQGELTTRHVDPCGLVHLGRSWYLAGYCHLRRGTRIFRLDRVRWAQVSQQSFTAPSAFDAFRVVTEAIAATPFPGTVACRVQLHCTLVEASRLIPPAAVVLEPDERGVLMTSHYPSEALEQLALHLLGFPFEVEVIEPRALQDALLAVAGHATRLASGESSHVCGI